MSDKTLITAHSGSDGTPDNSLACVRYAISTAVDAFEVDVRRLADGTLALGHDAADHETHNNDHNGLQQRDKALGRHLGLIVECLADGRQQAVQLAGLLAEVYLNIEEYVPDLYLNYRNIPDFELTAAEIITKVCREHGIATVNMNQVLITRRFIETLKDSGIALSAWTVNEEIFLDWFLTQGVRNITTRRPALALRLRDR